MTHSPDPLGFAPVASTSTRHDGWTPDRQRRFVEALSSMGIVARAARAVGMSATGAYALRRRPDAASFNEAWDIAVDMARDRLYALAIDRALNGYTVPRFYRGKQVGTVHRYDNRMIAAALSPVANPSDRVLPSLEELAFALTSPAINADHAKFDKFGRATTPGAPSRASIVSPPTAPDGADQ